MGATTGYVPNTDADRAAMLDALGLRTVDELFEPIPKPLRHPATRLPPALSELDLRRELSELSRRNLDPNSIPSFLGAGVYRHFVPAVVRHILLRGEFYTSYTPYQPEVSQGTLQVTYEFQSLVCALTGMDVANASMYDAATGMAEAALMAADLTGRRRVVVATSINPEYRAVLRTYAQGTGLEITPADLGAMTNTAVDQDVAALLIQHPDFFGCLEDVARWAEKAHAAGALLVVAVDPISLGILRPPGQDEADIVVAEGQSLGNAPSYGGPLLGIFACRERHVRRMPGRLVGATTDRQGRRGFVLTLQTREQHIRREKATSNICTNQALNALAATVYLSVLGPKGLRQVATLCANKAHYAAKRVAALPGYSLRFRRPFFKEFVVRCPDTAAAINEALLDQGVIGGYDLGIAYPELADCLLFCVTEMNTRDEIDHLVRMLADIAT